MSRLYGLRQVNELLRDVKIGVVKHGPIDEPSSVEPFLRVRVEADANVGSAQKGINTANPRKKLTIENRINLAFADTDKHPKTILDQSPERFSPDRENMGRWKGLHNFQEPPVPFKTKNVYGCLFVTLPDMVEHGLCQQEASHLRQEDNKEFGWFRRGSVLFRNGGQYKVLLAAW